MPVRLAEVAATAGVSVATVSRALNGKPGVGEDLRRRIREIAAAAGHRPTSVGTAGLVGVVVPELSTPSFAAFAQHAAIQLVQSGLAPMICPQTAPGVSEDEWLALLTARDVSAVLVVSGMHADTLTSPERYQRLRDAGIPLALVNGPVPDLDASQLSVDDVAGLETAVGHLVELGHRRLGLVTGPARYTTVRRKVAGLSAAAAGRRGVVTHVAHSVFTSEGGAAAMSQLLDAGVTGVVTSSAEMTLGAISAVRRRGLDVPADVSVVSFDDGPAGAHVDPPLTTLRQPVATMAATAVQALLDDLRTGERSLTELLFRPELVLRASTGASPDASRSRPRRLPAG